jgi:hypothetical protein
VGKEWGIQATGHILIGSQKVVQKYTILAGPVGQEWGKSVVFLATRLFSGGYTVIQKWHKGVTDWLKGWAELMQRVGISENGILGRVHKEYTKSTHFKEQPPRRWHGLSRHRTQRATATTRLPQQRP